MKKIIPFLLAVFIPAISHASYVGKINLDFSRPGYGVAFYDFGLREERLGVGRDLWSLTNAKTNVETLHVGLVQSWNVDSTSPGLELSVGSTTGNLGNPIAWVNQKVDLPQWASWLETAGTFVTVDGFAGRVFNLGKWSYGVGGKLGVSFGQ